MEARTTLPEGLLKAGGFTSWEVQLLKHLDRHKFASIQMIFELIRRHGHHGDASLKRSHAAGKLTAEEVTAIKAQRAAKYRTSREKQTYIGTALKRLNAKLRDRGTPLQIRPGLVKRTYALVEA